MGHVWAYKDPSGVIISATVALNTSDAWILLYGFLASHDREWGKRYWKRWDASRANARRRGYKLVKCRLEVA